MGPSQVIGATLSHLERYVGACNNDCSDYIVGDSLTVVDLGIFNAIDECISGPRGNQCQQGVEQELLKYYPQLMKTYEIVSRDLAQYICERQARFLHVT